MFLPSQSAKLYAKNHDVHFTGYPLVDKNNFDKTKIRIQFVNFSRTPLSFKLKMLNIYEIVFLKNKYGNIKSAIVGVRLRVIIKYKWRFKVVEDLSISGIRFFIP